MSSSRTLFILLALNAMLVLASAQSTTAPPTTTAKPSSAAHQAIASLLVMCLTVASGLAAILVEQ